MIFTDLGSYVTQAGISVLPWPILREAGVEGAIFKGDQEDAGVSTLASIKQAYDGGAKTVGCFYWDDPTVALTILLDRFKRAIDREKPEFLSVDIEMQKDWQGKPLDPSLVSDHAQGLTEGLAAYAPELLMMPYSANYMVEYAQKLATWIDNFENWTAAWTDSPMPRYEMSLAEISRGDVRQTWYDAAGKPMRNPDGSYLYSTYQIQDRWQAATSKKICLLRQYSSRILLPYSRVGGTIYNHQYDWDYTPLTIDEWKKKIKHEYPGEINMIYNPLVPMKNRAFGNLWTAADASAKSADVFSAVDFGFVQMGGKSDIDKTPIMIEESGWTARLASLKAAGKPVVGQLEISADWYIRKETDKGLVDNWTFIQNPFALQLMKLWRTNPVYDWKTITAVDGGWRPLGGLSFLIWETKSYIQGDIPGVWQVSTLSFIEQLHALQVAGKVPNIPLMVNCSPAFAKIPEVTTWLNDRGGMAVPGAQPSGDAARERLPGGKPGRVFAGHAARRHVHVFERARQPGEPGSFPPVLQRVCPGGDLRPDSK